MGNDSVEPAMRVVSVVIPARNESARIGELVRTVRGQADSRLTLEVIVVDDHSTDGTARRAEEAGARVLGRVGPASGGNPAAARNLGARASLGDPIVFLDADCMPSAGWLRALLRAHDGGHVIVGGAMDLPPGLPAVARCDYYCGWYLVHSRRPAGFVPHHPPPNLSVRRDPFLASRGFTESQPYAYANEERRWQAELRQRGAAIWFEPEAVVYHRNRPGLGNLLRRDFRWAYTAVAAKSETGVSRATWLWRHPWLAVVGSLPLALLQGLFIVGCWIRAGRVEPVLMSPAILASRLAYAAGLSVGGLRWLRGGKAYPDEAPPWS